MSWYRRILCFLGIHSFYHVKEKYNPYPLGPLTDPYKEVDWNHCISDYSRYCHYCDLHHRYLNYHKEWSDVTFEERRERNEEAYLKRLDELSNLNKDA